MQFRRQRREEDSINLTPLIDVVFLLLIFFMVSTTFTNSTHLTIDLPEAVGTPTRDNDLQLDIVIGADGSYQLNGQPLINSQADTLKAALLGVAEGDTETPLTITADARTPHQAVVTAMDVAGQAGFNRLSITTREPQAETP